MDRALENLFKLSKNHRVLCPVEGQSLELQICSIEECFLRSWMPLTKKYFEKIFSIAESDKEYRDYRAREPGLVT